MNRRRTAALGDWLRARARWVLAEERGIALVSQLAGLVIGLSVLGAVTVVFDAVEGASKSSEAVTTGVQHAQNGIDLVVNTLTDAVEGGYPAVWGTAKVVVAQVPEEGAGFRVVRFCLQTGQPNGGVLYQQMVHESTIDSSSFIWQGIFSSQCPDTTWIYNGTLSANAIADRISNYEGSPTHPVFTYPAAPSGGRRSLAIDLFVTPDNAPAATELTGEVTPRLQIGPK